MTDNRQEVMNIISSNAPNIKVLDLEEDASLPLDHPMVANGIAILPPVDSMIAEQDGNANAYFDFYYKRMCEPEQEDFMTAIICFLCNGNTMVVYIPNIRSVLASMFRKVIDAKYGILIGMYPQEQTLYNYDFAPVWLWKMYTVNFISARDYMILFPKEQLIPDYAKPSLMYELNLFGTDYQDKSNSLERIKNRLKEDRNFILPVCNVNISG